jgi:hypothetical protein
MDDDGPEKCNAVEILLTLFLFGVSLNAHICSLNEYDYIYTTYAYNKLKIEGGGEIF